MTMRIAPLFQCLDGDSREPRISASTSFARLASLLCCDCLVSSLDLVGVIRGLLVWRAHPSRPAARREQPVISRAKVVDCRRNRTRTRRGSASQISGCEASLRTMHIGSRWLGAGSASSRVHEHGKGAKVVVSPPEESRYTVASK